MSELFSEQCLLDLHWTCAFPLLLIALPGRREKNNVANANSEIEKNVKHICVKELFPNQSLAMLVQMVGRINWMADRSEKGLKQSAGIMVNYIYE